MAGAAPTKVAEKVSINNDNNNNNNNNNNNDNNNVVVVEEPVTTAYGHVVGKSLPPAVRGRPANVSVVAPVVEVPLVVAQPSLFGHQDFDVVILKPKVGKDKEEEAVVVVEEEMSKNQKKKQKKLLARLKAEQEKKDAAVLADVAKLSKYQRKKLAKAAQWIKVN